VTKHEIFLYLGRRRLSVLATTAADGSPQAALIGIAVTENLDLIFDTLASSRKHQNLLREPRAALVFSGPGERTLQCEGQASQLTASDTTFREAYYAAWPDAPSRADWPGLVYWRIVPRWARYADYERSEPPEECHWPA